VVHSEVPEQIIADSQKLIIQEVTGRKPGDKRVTATIYEGIIRTRIIISR
jgi:hypothetical protein